MLKLVASGTGGSEPPTLFDVPADYTIKDEQGMINEKIMHERKKADEALQK